MSNEEEEDDDDDDIEGRKAKIYILYISYLRIELR